MRSKAGNGHGGAAGNGGEDPPFLRINNLKKSFSISSDEEFIAVDDFTLDLREGEFFCLLGPSGCGKSTVLNMVAGFEPQTAGTIELAGEAVSAPSPQRGVVFQGDDSLYPWLTTRENVEFGLRMRGMPKQQRKELADIYLRKVGLAKSASKYPAELSGGMKQRVQIARILCSDPTVMLMDEPFGALDAITRESIQNELANIWSEERKTVLFITHDLEEAILLGDRLGIMSSGPSATIKEIIPVDLPRPRSRLDGAFTDIYRDCRQIVAEEALKAMGMIGK